MLRVLVWKDIRRWWSDRNAMIVTLALPLALTGVLGASFGGFGGSGPAMDAIPLAIVGDVPGVLRDMMDDALSETELFAPTWCDSSTAETLVRAGDVRAALIIPQDLLSDLFSGGRVVIGVWKDPVSVFQADVVQQILERMLLNVQSGEAVYYGAWPEDWYPEEGQETPMESLFEGDSMLEVWKRVRNGTDEATAAWDQLARMMDHQVALGDAFEPPAVVVDVVDRDGLSIDADADPRGSRNMFDYILPGMGVFFLMFAASNASGDLHRERESGTLRRLFVAPLGDSDLLLGKWLYAMLNGMLQLAVLLIAGKIFFRLNLGPDPYALPLAAVATASMLASFFLPLALIARNEKQLGQLATGLILFMGLVGGNFINPEQMPPFLKAVGRFTPNYWANTAFNDVIAYDRGVSAIGVNLLVLAGVSVFMFGLALLLYKRRGGKEGLL